MDSDVRQKEISRDIDSYISSKRKGSGLFGMFSKREDDVVMTHPGVKPYDDAPVEPAPAVVDTPHVQAEEFPADEKGEKKGWFSRWFNDEGQQVQEIAAEQQLPSDDADLREVARITLAFMRMTDAAALAQIKSSPDFDKFKEILRRRNIIK